MRDPVKTERIPKSGNRFSDRNARPGKDLELRFDSIETQQALSRF
jgi:hypothetical protein